MYVVNCLDSVMGGLLSLEEAWTSFKNQRYDHCAMYVYMPSYLLVFYTGNIHYWFQ